jgi:hypothetical protein
MIGSWPIAFNVYLQGQSVYTTRRLGVQAGIGLRNNFVPSRRVNQEEGMRKASAFVLVAALAVLVIAVSPSSASAKGKKMAGAARWHGVLVRISEDGMTYTVRKGNLDKAIHVTADTKFTKAEGKKVVDIDKGDVKEGDDIICIGKYDDKGDFEATRIDKRLPK